MSTDAIYAVLVRGSQLTESETHILLDRVRAGASLLVLLGGGPLRDSLHMDIGERQGMLARGADSVSCPQRTLTIRGFQTRVPFIASEVERTGPLAGDTVHLAVMGSTRSRLRPAILGMALGRGRI